MWRTVAASTPHAQYEIVIALPPGHPFIATLRRRRQLGDSAGIALGLSCANALE